MSFGTWHMTAQALVPAFGGSIAFVYMQERVDNNARALPAPKGTETI